MIFDNLKCFSIWLIVFCISCGNQDLSTKTVKAEIIHRRSIYYANPSFPKDFKAPIQINEFRIMAGESATKKLGKSFESIDDDGQQFQLVAFNIDKTQVLILDNDYYDLTKKDMQHYMMTVMFSSDALPENDSNIFSPVQCKTIQQLPDKMFSTEGGIALGMPVKAVEDIIGMPYKIYYDRHDLSGQYVYEYKLSHELKPDLLLSYNAIESYVFIAKFKFHKLIYYSIRAVDHYYPYDYP